MRAWLSLARARTSRLPWSGAPHSGEGLWPGQISLPPAEHWVGAQTGGFTFMILRDRHSGERMGERLVALADEFDLPYFRGIGRYFMGWAKAQGVTLSEGLALMEETFAPNINELLYKFLAAPLAEARFEAGRL